MPACSAGSEDQRVDIYVVHGATTDVVPGGTPRYSRDGMSEKSQAFKGSGVLVVCDGAGVDTAAKLVVKQDGLVLLEEHLLDDGYAVGQDDDRGCLSWVTSPDEDGAGGAGREAAASIKVVFHSSEYFSRVTGFMSAYFYPPHGDLVDTSAEVDDDTEEEGTRKADCFPATASVTEYKQTLCRPSLPLLERHYVARSLLSRGHLDYLVHCARDAAEDEAGKDVRIMFEILAGVLSVGAASVYARVFSGGDPFCDVFFALMARLVGMRKGGSVGRRKGVRSPKKARLEAAVRECLEALPAYLSDDEQARGLIVAAAKSRFFDNEIVNVVKSSSSNASSASSSSSDTPARRAAAAAAAASPPHIVHIKRGFVAHDNHLKEQLARRTVNLAVASTAPPSQLLADHLTFAASVLGSIEQRGTQYDALYRLVHPEEGGLLLDLFVKGLSRVGPAEEAGWNTAAVFDAMYLFFGKAAEARNELPITALREVLVRMHADREQVSEENAATVFLKLLLFAAAEGFDACNMLYHLLGLHDPEGFTEERTNDVRINCVRDQFVDLFHEEYLGSLVAALSLHSATNQTPLPAVLRILTASLKLRKPAQRLHVLELAVSEGTEVLEELCASVAKGGVALSKESTIELAKFAAASLCVLRTLGHEAHAAAVQERRRQARAEREERGGRPASTADGEAGGSTASTSTSSASSSASFTIEAPAARVPSHAELPSAAQPRCLRLASLSVATANFEKFLCRTGLLSYLVHDTLGREVARGTKGIVYTCIVGLMGQVAADGSGAPADGADVSAVSSATGDVGLEAQAYGEDLVRPTFAILRSFLVANNCGGFFLAASPLQPHARPADTCLAHIVAETTKMWMREQSRPWLAQYAEPLPSSVVEEEEEVTIEHTGEESAEVSASEQEALTDTTLSYVAEPCVASSCVDDDTSYNVEAERRRRWRQRRICSLTEENLRLNSSILEMESSCGASLPSMSDASSVVESADSYCSAANDADSPAKAAQSKERSPSPAYHTRLLLATSKRAYYDLRGNGPMSPFTDYTLDSRAKEGTLSSVSHAADSILSEDDCFALNHKLQLQEEARWGKRPAARALAESLSESTPTAATLVLSKRNLSLLTSSLLVADAGMATPTAQPAADTEAEDAPSPPVSFESLASDAMHTIGGDAKTSNEPFDTLSPEKPFVTGIRLPDEVVLARQQRLERNGRNPPAKGGRVRKPLTALVLN